MSIEVIKAGMLTTLQDGGRRAYMASGVCHSGAMDRLSMQLANTLLGNQPEHPVLEITLLGATLRVTQAMSVAVCGAVFELSVHQQQGHYQVTNNQTINLNPGDVLQFGQRHQGARAYLAFAASPAFAPQLGSYATHLLAAFGGFHGRALQAGDVLPLRDCEIRPSRQLPASLQPGYSGAYQLRCIDSVETGLFSAAQQTHFYQTLYTVSNDSNRMGLRLSGVAMDTSALAQMVSSGLLPGSVQIPPSGLPILSSVDGQTIGGYPRIANVCSADLFALGQLLPGDTLSFVRVSLEQAFELFAQQQQLLGLLK